MIAPICVLGHLAAVLAASSLDSAAVAPTEPIPQQAYVWQRDWNGPVAEAVTGHSQAFQELVVLAAEVNWECHRPRATRVPLAYDRLRPLNAKLGLALRIGPYAGPFRAEGEPIDSLTGLAASLLAEAKASQVKVHELQIDFDCADAKLAGYQLWLEVLRRRIAPLKVTFTALPSWLRQAAFKGLASTAPGYVLQVHSLERPKGIGSVFSLCDAKTAVDAVERAARYGVPFRVALPTYGYVVAFNQEGQFIGLSAEGPSKAWPPGFQTREIRSDPAEMAGLVRTWSARRPALLEALIWYRLPTDADRLNWRWLTLAAVMNGRMPHPAARVEAARPEPGLVEVQIVNDGEADAPLPGSISLTWQDGRVVAADALPGFELVERRPRVLFFSNRAQTAGARLPAGSRRVIGWVRLSQDQEVKLEIE